MGTEEVRIVRLEPMIVATFYGFGPSPEAIAWEKLIAWAKPRGLLDEPGRRRLFGFNNPNPAAGSPNYGYEVWIVVDAGVEPEGDMRCESFAGGLYAVMRCEVPKGDFAVIGATWTKLVAWREESRYRAGTHQWLEESLPLALPDTEFVLDLFLPIAA